MLAAVTHSRSPNPEPTQASPVLTLTADPEPPAPRTRATEPNNNSAAPGPCRPLVPALFDHDQADMLEAPSTALPVRDRQRYQFGAEHARGGIGKIVLAHDRKLDRQVAIKELLRPGNAAQARFVREAMITARLEHPGIVPVHEAGRWPSGEPFYSMKLVSGRSLAEVIKSTRTLDERLALLPNVVAVADAIAYAHGELVIHRDLKPSNVMVGACGETVVIDWGLAKDLTRPNEAADLLAEPSRNSSQSGLTMVGTVIGTPAYMPPEQAEGLPVDERADVYALGAMLYHLLAGQIPYADTKPTSGSELVDLVKAGPPTSLPRLGPDTPAGLLAIIDKAMARKPSDRYANAGELAVDLKRCSSAQLLGARECPTWMLPSVSRRALARPTPAAFTLPAVARRSATHAPHQSCHRLRRACHRGRSSHRRCPLPPGSHTHARAGLRD
jgi:serine/threonine protein kinase